LHLKPQQVIQSIKRLRL